MENVLEKLATDQVNRLPLGARAYKAPPQTFSKFEGRGKELYKKI